MSNEDKLKTLKKRIFNLTVSNNKSSDLDVLLERLFDILADHPDLQLEQQGAIVLLNPRGSFFQVAQFGIPPPWESHFRWNLGPFASPEIPTESSCHTIAFFSKGNKPTAQQCLLLPLNIDNKGIGYTVLFVHEDYQTTAIHHELNDELSLALSSLVHRTLTNETLRIRELELEESRANAIHSLGVASEYRDNETGWHIMRMSNYAQAISKALGLSQEERELLYIAAPMHDVGKIGISDAVLLKPGKLSAEEFDIMKTHTNIGVSILSGNDALIAAARDIAGSHHERWDGKGYPQGLAGDKIPILARICAVADVFDAITSVRPYKEAWPVDEAISYVISESGKYFDPSIVNAFQKALPEILRIRELYRDDIIDPKKTLSLPPVEPREHIWVKWSDNLSVGIDVIDEHHRYLFDLVNDLFDVVINKRGAREVARLIKSVDAYAKVHFRSEEQMMGHYAYRGIQRQEQQHHAFEKKILEFYEELHNNPLVAQFDALSYLREWLLKHILVEDAELRTLANM